MYIMVCVRKRIKEIKIMNERKKEKQNKTGSSNKII